MLKVLQSGFYTSIPDIGRFGFREYGVPFSGAMDAYSLKYANAILGNNENDAVIEMTMVGGIFQFTEATVIVISGADMEPKLNDRVAQLNSPINIKAGDILSFGRALKGFRSYLAIKNGFKTPLILRSRSLYKPITESSMIANGDMIQYTGYNEFYHQNASVKYDSSIFSNTLIEAFKGPEFNRLSEIQKATLFNSELKVSSLNNRMAYQLEPLLKNDMGPILTSPVLPGTVQLTPQGNIIVLMRDCQTTGGYPRILQLTEKAINILSQKTTGNTLKIRQKV